MTRYISGALLLSLPFMVASCSVVQKQPKKYKSITTRNYVPAKDSIKYYVGISGYAHAVPGKQKKQNSEPAKNIFSLSGEGQKQLIEAIADNEESTEEIYTKLAQDIVPAKKHYAATSGIGRTFTRRVVLAVDDMHMTQSDKVQKLTIMLAAPQGSNIKVVSCGKLTSNYRSAAVTVKGNNNAGTTLQPVALSSAVTPEGLTITAANMDGNELTGNITADVTFEYTGAMKNDNVFSFSDLWNRDHTAAKPNDIKAIAHSQKYPAAAATDAFKLSYEATVYHVAKGENTISTSDDVVEIIKGKATAPDMVIVKDGQLMAKQWMISDGHSHIDLSGSFYHGTLLFDSYEDAQDFILWFKRSSADILANSRISSGDYRIGISGDVTTLTDTFIENCKITSANKD